jgi:molybdopterin/thiamine biosynthesis adenylyltransferase
MSNVSASRNPALPGLNIAVVGAGRVGLEVIRNLSLMGIGRIDVFECDQHAAEPLRNRYRVYEGDFWDTLTLARLQNYDFAVCTIDARSARNRMNGKCVLANVNFVQVSAADTLAQVSAYPFGVRHDSACAECGTSTPTAVPMPIAALRLSVADEARESSGAAGIATASVAGGMAAALIARIAAGSHGAVARAATLDAALGEGTSVELRRDANCPRCSSLQRPVPIVHTRNRWHVKESIAQACPESLDQHLRLSDEIEGLTAATSCLRELSARFQGRPIPAKFALADVGGRTICLAFEETGDEPAPAAPRATAGHHPSG